MVVSTDGVSLTPSAGTFKDTGLIKSEARDWADLGNNILPYIFLPLNDPMGNPLPNGSIGPGVDYTVPIGSVIRIQLKGDRNGASGLFGSVSCEERRIDIDETFVATEAYNNLAQWFEQSGAIQSLIDPSFSSAGNALVANGGVHSPIAPTDPSTVPDGNGNNGNGKSNMDQELLNNCGVRS